MSRAPQVLRSSGPRSPRTVPPLRGDALFRGIFDSSVAVCVTTAADGRILLVNRRYAELVGRDPADLTGRCFLELTHPDDRESNWRGYQQLLAGESDAYRARKRYVRPDGSIRHVQVDAALERDGRGRALHAVAIVHDVTAQHEAEEALRRAHQEAESRARAAEKSRVMLDAILRHIPMGIVVASAPDFRFLAASDWGRSMLGLPEGPLDHLRLRSTGLPWALLHLDGVTPAALDEFPLVRAIRGGEVVEQEEWLLLGEDKEVVPILCNAGPIRDEEGRILGGVVGWQDISGQKRLAEAQREADRRKDAFLATLAHELRNPLAPIRTGLELLAAAPNDPAEVRRVRRMMERHARQLTRLLDDLMDISRITRGSLELRTEEVVLQDVLQAAIEESRPLFEARRHRLFTRLPRHALVLRADPARLAQVFVNLLNNAARYTDEGGEIHLDVERDAESGSDQAVVRVRDDGIGIPPHLLESVFDMFARGDQASAARGAGLGIGLTLVRSLVELHGGSVRAFSEGHGCGSELVVRLPRGEPSRGPGAEGTTRAPAGPLRVLVVDDDRDLADSCAVLLRRRGHAVAVAYDGASAVARALEWEPDLVLLDLGLPDVGGCAVARTLRAHRFPQPLRLVALTGRGQAADRDLTRASGFDGHLLKPAAIDEIQHLIADLIAH